MSHVWALIIIILAFGVAGKIDYEVAVTQAATTTCERAK